jgi:dihydroorotate dehydrogenase (NAD+) catalytic subunit
VDNSMTMARQDLSLNSPWMNAAGTLGYRPTHSWNWPEPQGAFITNPISMGRRTPAGERALIPYPGGFLLHTGLPNPGLAAVLKQNRQRWQRSAVPVWVHLMPSSPDELKRMMDMLEDCEAVTGIELGISPKAGPSEAVELVSAAGFDLPLIVSVSVTSVGESWLERLPGLGVAAISLTAPRGSLAGHGGQMVTGRLYGPSLLPLALAGVSALKKLEIPIIAGCGVYQKIAGEALLAAGAWAVQLDSVLWKTAGKTGGE